MKNTAKLTAVQDILLDPDFISHRNDGIKRNMGYVHPSKSKIEQYSPKKPKKSAK